MRNTAPLLRLAEGDCRSPVEEAILKDCYAFFINALPDKLRSLAELHLAGFTNGEIAGRTNCVERTVERKLVLLRACWKSLADHTVKAPINEVLAR